MYGLELLLDDLGYIDAGWEADGDDALICPHGNLLELDGRCDEGCVSPLLLMGMI